MKRRILVVDDEAIVAHDISEALTHMGCEVVGRALSGPEAIAEAEGLRPDLIMMDIVLQGPMDGVEAANIIRQRYDIPCVFLTAYSDSTVLARAKKAAPAKAAPKKAAAKKAAPKKLAKKAAKKAAPKKAAPPKAAKKKADKKADKKAKKADKKAKKAAKKKK